MTGRRDEFVMSVEQELMTVVEDDRKPRRVEPDLSMLFGKMKALAPSLDDFESRGFYNAYGRVYLDTGYHVEFALPECSSPYLVPLLLERQQELARRAIDELKEQGLRLRLANNNHSGLLTRQSPVWGAHENFFVERSPSEFSDEILPFLVTRVYAGAGGIEFPTGRFLAGVRPLFMRQTTGGSTTERETRAIHSTCREEHHMGPSTDRFRYHLICGDGHRSHFNLALQLGATALALKAILVSPASKKVLRRLPGLRARGSWVRLLRSFNRLAEPGEPPKVDPTVIQVQRLFLEAAAVYAESLDELPEWIPRLLGDWERTLDAYESDDRDWLAARLDAFIKHEFFSTVLGEAGRSWDDLGRGDEVLFSRLALLDQSYHEFHRADSVFTQLERARCLDHRVGEEIGPGSEAEAFVPETGTRASARARFIREHAGSANLVMNWSFVTDCETRRVKRLDGPFATKYTGWEGQTRRRRRLGSPPGWEELGADWALDELVDLDDGDDVDSGAEDE